MTQSINWDVLETQYFADGQYREKLSKMVTVVDDSFIAGKHFIKNFNQSMKELKEDINETKELTLEPEKVNLSVINQTNPEHAKKTFLKINGKSNKLNLSEHLLNKLLSGERCELTASEINELNEKIKIALNRLKDKTWEKETSDVISEQAKLTVIEQELEPAASTALVQSDTLATEASTVISSAYNLSKTKLMSLLTYDKEKEIVPAQETQEKNDYTGTNWWEKESLQFMRGMVDLILASHLYFITILFSF